MYPLNPDIKVEIYLQGTHLRGSRRERVEARAPPMECPVRKMRFPLPADVTTAKSLSRTVLPGWAGSAWCRPAHSPSCTSPMPDQALQVMTIIKGHMKGTSFYMPLAIIYHSLQLAAAGKPYRSLGTQNKSHPDPTPRCQSRLQSRLPSLLELLFTCIIFPWLSKIINTVHWLCDQLL